jgi:hypothetical protein
VTQAAPDYQTEVWEYAFRNINESMERFRSWLAVSDRDIDSGTSISDNAFPSLRTLKAAFLNTNTFIVTIHPNHFVLLLCLKLLTCAESSEAAFHFVATVSTVLLLCYLLIENTVLLLLLQSSDQRFTSFLHIYLAPITSLISLKHRNTQIFKACNPLVSTINPPVSTTASNMSEFKLEDQEFNEETQDYQTDAQDVHSDNSEDQDDDNDEGIDLSMLEAPPRRRRGFQRKYTLTSSERQMAEAGIKNALETLDLRLQAHKQRLTGSRPLANHFLKSYKTHFEGLKYFLAKIGDYNSMMQMEEKRRRNSSL